MKVAYNSQIFTAQKYGGISRYFVRLGEELSVNNNTEIGFFAPMHKNYYLDNVNKDLVHGKYIKSYPLKSRRFFKIYNRLKGRYEITKWEPDVIHETYYTDNKTVKSSAPSVITVHDMIHELFPTSFSASDRTSSLKRNAVIRADHVICVSKNTKNDLLNYFKIPENKVTVIHHGIDGLVDANEISLETQKRFNQPYLLYVGNREGYKNFVSFIKAYSQSELLKNDFQVIAFGGGEFNKSELTLLYKLDLKDNVIYRQGDDQLMSYLYSNATALIYPSIYEGFGMPTLEAMAHRCPVIASNSSSIPEVVADAGHYFDPKNIDSIKNSIEEVVYSSHIIDELITKGNERLKHFSWKECAKKTKSVYKKIIQTV